MGRSGALAVAVGLVHLVASASAETPPVFSDRTVVRIVNVDVTVLDRHGEPVTGLGAGDFEVFEDGERVEVVNFEAFEAADASPEAESTGAPPSESGPVAAVETDGPGLELIVAVDNLNILPHHRKQRLDQIDRFLAAELEPEDRVTVVVLTNGQVSVLVVRSNDLAAVRESFELIESSNAGGVYDRLNRKYFLDDRESILQSGQGVDDLTGPDLVLQQVITSPTDGLLDGLARGRAVQEAAWAGDTLDSLDALTKLLAGLPGRKSVLYVGGGFHLNPGSYYFYTLDETGRRFTTDITELEQSRQIREMTNAANTSRVTFFPVDSVGVPASTETWGPETEARLSLHGALFSMADETGGRATLGQNLIAEPLERVAREARSYYSLAYRPPESNRADRQRRITVRLAGEHDGMELRHRRGYREVEPSEGLVDRSEAAFHGFADDTLQATVALVERDGRDRLRIVVPRSRLGLEPAGDGWAGTLRLAITVERGDEIVTRAMPISLTVADATEGVEVIEVGVPPEASDGVGVAILDDVTGVLSSYAVSAIGRD